jgi:hypothetical protein
MIESRFVWEAAERLNLYAWSDEELEALIVKHADPVITAGRGAVGIGKPRPGEPRGA